MESTQTIKGFSLSARSVWIIAAWSVGLLGPCWLLNIRDHFSPWALMWLLIAWLYFTFKVLSLCYMPESWVTFPPGRMAAFLLLWPGMRPQVFMKPATAAADQDLWVTGTRNLLAGSAFLMISLLCPGPRWLNAWLAMIAFSFTIHFGLFDLLAACWRRAGIGVDKLFDCPLAATSLADFWGNRWNRAFSEFARSAIFQPVARRLGSTAAMLAVFLFSGLVHDVVISGAAGAGYGGPTFYFLLQAALLLAEKMNPLRACFRSRPVLGRLWTALVVLAPLPLLFHEPFLRNVIIPDLIGG